MAKKLTAAQAKARSKNPRTRTSVPTSQLSPQHRAMRAKAVAAKKKTAALDDPEALTAPMTPRILAEQVKAQTGLQYGAADRELQGQRGVNAQMAQNIPSWFQSYQDSLARSTALQQAATANAVAAQQNAMMSASGIDERQRGQQQAAMQSDAATRGATVDPNIAATAQQAAAARNSSAAAFTGLTAGLGAAREGLAANRETVGAGQRVSAQLAERNVGLNIDSKASQLAAEKGQFAVTARQKLIDAEHTKGLERKAFGLSEAKAAADVRNEQDKLKVKVKTHRENLRLKKDALEAKREMDAALRSNNRARIRIAEENLRVAQRRARAYERGQATSSAGGVTVAEQRRRNDSISKIGSDYAKALRDLKLGLSGATGVKLEPSELGMAIDRRYPKLPRAARDKIIREAQGKNSTPQQRKAYHALLADIRAGKISY